MKNDRRVVYPGQIYKHFKGNLYQIITVAVHSETGEELVIYQKLYGDFKVHARPYDMFVSEVDKVKYPDVTQKYRFELVTNIGDESVNRAEESSEFTKTLESVVEQVVEKEGEANPYLLMFLDTDTYEQKKEVLSKIHNKMTDRLIDDIAASIDVIVEQGNLDTRYRSLMNCIDTRLKFECNRFR